MATSKRHFKKNKESKDSIEIGKTITHFLPKTPNYRVYTTINQRNESQLVTQGTENSQDDEQIDYHRKLKPLKIQTLNLPDNRRVIFKQYHNFGIGLGDHLVEISMCKLKFYILIMEGTRSLKTPHLIELYIPQAKKLFEYCHRSYKELLDLVEYKYNKFQMIDINKIFWESIDFYFNKTKNSFMEGKTSYPREPKIRNKISINTSLENHNRYENRDIKDSVKKA